MNPGNGKGPGPDHAAAPGPSGDETRKAAAESRSSATAGAGRMLGAGVPAEKPKDLRGSVRRMAGLMSPERSRAISVVVFARKRQDSSMAKPAAIHITSAPIVRK